MNNRLIQIQEMLFNQMKRLDNDEIMKENGSEEIARGNALSGNAVTFLKIINIGIRILECSQKYDMQKKDLTKMLGVSDEN